MTNAQIQAKLNKAKDDLIHIVCHTHLFLFNAEAMAKADKLRSKIERYERTLAVREMAKALKANALSYEVVQG